MVLYQLVFGIKLPDGIGNRFATCPENEFSAGIEFRALGDVDFFFAFNFAFNFALDFAFNFAFNFTLNFAFNFTLNFAFSGKIEVFFNQVKNCVYIATEVCKQFGKCFSAVNNRTRIKGCNSIEVNSPIGDAVDINSRTGDLAFNGITQRIGKTEFHREVIPVQIFQHKPAQNALTPGTVENIVNNGAVAQCESGRTQVRCSVTVKGVLCCCKVSVRIVVFGTIAGFEKEICQVAVAQPCPFGRNRSFGQECIIFNQLNDFCSISRQAHQIRNVNGRLCQVFGDINIRHRQSTQLLIGVQIKRKDITHRSQIDGRMQILRRNAKQVRQQAELRFVSNTVFIQIPGGIGMILRIVTINVDKSNSVGNSGTAHVKNGGFGGDKKFRAGVFPDGHKKNRAVTRIKHSTRRHCLGNDIARIYGITESGNTVGHDKTERTDGSQRIFKFLAHYIGHINRINNHRLHLVGNNHFIPAGIGKHIRKRCTAFVPDGIGLNFFKRFKINAVFRNIGFVNGNRIDGILYIRNFTRIQSKKGFQIRPVQIEERQCTQGAITPHGAKDSVYIGIITQSENSSAQESSTVGGESEAHGLNIALALVPHIAIACLVNHVCQGTVFFTRPIGRNSSTQKGSVLYRLIQFRLSGIQHLFAKRLGKRCQSRCSSQIRFRLVHQILINDKIGIKGVFYRLNINEGMLGAIRQAQQFGEQHQLIVIAHTVFIQVPGTEIVKLGELSACVNARKCISDSSTGNAHLRIAQVVLVDAGLTNGNTCRQA